MYAWNVCAYKRKCHTYACMHTCVDVRSYHECACILTHAGTHANQSEKQALYAECAALRDQLSREIDHRQSREGGGKEDRDAWGVADVSNLCMCMYVWMYVCVYACVYVCRKVVGKKTVMHGGSQM